MYLCVQTEAIQKKSLRLCVTFLEHIAKQTCSVILEICAEQCNLNDQVKFDSVTMMTSVLATMQTMLSFRQIHCSCGVTV